MRSGTVDIVFANKQEALSLYETDDFELALTKIAADCKIAAVTMSEEGAVILRGTERVKVEAYPVHDVVDTTGVNVFSLPDSCLVIRRTGRSKIAASSAALRLPPSFSRSARAPCHR